MNEWNVSAPPTKAIPTTILAIFESTVRTNQNDFVEALARFMEVQSQAHVNFETRPLFHMTSHCKELAISM
jgi:hypothetical protein